MSDEIQYTECLECRIEFKYPTSLGKTWIKSEERVPTVVVDGYCFDCCDKKATAATIEINKLLENHPDIKKVFDNYVYCVGLKLSAIMLD